MNKFLMKIAEILEVEGVQESDQLEAFPQLDSIGVLSVIVMMDADYGVNLSTADIGRMVTFGELWNYVQCLVPSKGSL